MRIVLNRSIFITLKHPGICHFCPDSERLRKLGEFDPDFGDSNWAGGVDSKFSDLNQKYGLSYRLTNPQSGPLSRRNIEGQEYRLQDSIYNLVEEFQKRCGQ